MHAETMLIDKCPCRPPTGLQPQQQRFLLCVQACFGLTALVVAQDSSP